MASLTKEVVLRAVCAAPAPYSNYIGREVCKAHNAHVAAGGKGFPPTAALILRRLEQLADEGMLVQSEYPNGHYGYRWDVTEAGRAAIEGITP